MKKRFMNALLLGALVFASTSTFVSCKDYDDDITNLQEQINKLSALEKLSTDVTALQTAVQNAQSDATKALDEAKKASDAAAKAATPEQLKAVQDAIAAAEAKIADKADKSTVEALQSLVNENKDKLDGISAEVAEQLADALNKYALGADVDELAGKVAELEQKINNNQPVEPGEDVADLTAKYNALAAQADAMKIAYSTMITNISLVASLQKTYTIQGSDVLDNVKVQGFFYRDGQDITDWWAGSDEYMQAYIYPKYLRYSIDSELGFVVAEEQDNLFPEDAASVTEQLEFKKGISSVQGDMVLVRVNPTNAVLKPENISLINSQGEELTGLVDCVSAKPYDGLLTRAAGEGTGLWIVTYNLKKDFKNDDLKAARWDKYNNEILYAVSVKTDAEEENVNTDRRVVSEYDVTLATSNGRDAYDFNVNKKSIWEIHNRYSYSETSTEVSTRGIKELNWIGDPAVKAITEGDGLNAKDRYNGMDDRQWANSLPVVMNEDIVIEYPSSTPIKGFYVTLDYDFAVGDGNTDVSEINAWNSYTYENVGKYKFNGFKKIAVDVPATMFKGNVGTIKIKDLNNVKGDIIGFRVYAVNLDGTLVDPDGRAFYVAIGDEVQNGTEIADKENEYAEIKPVQNEDKTYSVQGKSDMLDLDNIEFVKGVTTWGYENSNNWLQQYMWQASEDNKDVDGRSTTVTINFYKKDGKTQIPNSQLAEAINKGEAVKYQIVVSNLANFFDNEVYAQTMTTYNVVNNSNIPVQTVTFQWKKVLPTTIPVDFAFRPKQETVEGSGNFIAYMYPDQENKLDYSVSAFKGVGAKDMRDVFYGLDRNFNFELCTSAKDADDKLISKNVVCQDTKDAYPFDVNADFVDSETKHDVNISYNYGAISTFIDAKGLVQRGEDWTVDYAKNPLTVTYACWETQNKYSWKDKSDATKGLQWTAAGSKVDVMSNTILIKNGYNNDFFGMDMLKATWEKKFLEVVPGSEKLVWEGQVNPYFKPAFSADYDRITFTQQSIQADANPTANHTEQLVFKVKDCFGHEAEISLPIEIKKAAAAAPAK